MWQNFIGNNQKNIILFVITPLLFNAVFIGFYFSGNLFLQHLIAPEMPTMAPNSWREFGLVEQTQNLLLLIITLLLFKEIFNRSLILEKIIFALGFIVFSFLLLEEIDYGLHFYEYLSD